MQQSLRFKTYVCLIPLLAGLSSVTPTVAQQPTSVEAGSSGQSSQSFADQGHAFYLNHRNTEAVAALLEAVKQNPHDARSYLELGISYNRLNQFKNSEPAFQHVIRLEPHGFWTTRAYSNLGFTYTVQKRYTEAEAAYKQAIQLNPSLLVNYAQIGRFYSERGRNAEATAAFQHAIQLQPRPVQPDPTATAIDYQRRGLAFRYLGQMWRALSDFDAGLRLDPHSTDILSNRSYSYLIAGRGDLAAADSAAYLAMRSGHTSGANYQTIVAYLGYLMAHHADAAASVLQEAEVKGDPKAWPFPVIQFLRGQINAQQLIAHATDNSELTEAHAYLGLARALTGHPAQAIPQFQWVRQHGVRAYAEYQLSEAELARLK